MAEIVKIAVYFIIMKKLFFILIITVLLLSSCISSSYRKDTDRSDDTESRPERSLEDAEAEKADQPAAEKETDTLDSDPASGRIKDRECEKIRGRELYTALRGKKIVYQGISYFPVYAGPELTYTEGDFFLDPCTEYAVLYAEALLPEDADRDKVSSIRNIFEKEENLKKYLIAVYSYGSGNLKYTKIIGLKGRGAFSSINNLLVDRISDTLAVSVTFNTLEGTYEEIIIFNRNSNYAVSEIRNTLSTSIRKEDIDGNGKIDILRYEQIFVEGTGAETFITWLKLDGINYIPVKTINILGSLRDFFERSRMLLERKNISGFVENAAAGHILKPLKNMGITDSDILHRIFFPARKENNTRDADIIKLMDECESMAVVFPELFENPFRVDRDGLYSFTTYVRINYRTKDSDVDNEALYLVRIYMMPNPFDSRRFAFFIQ